MGYQITWKVKDLPEDIKEKYKPLYKDRDKLKELLFSSRQEIILYCMRLNNNSPIDIDNLKFKLNLYKSLLIDDWKHDLLDRLNEEEIWFCGWEFFNNNSVGDTTDIIYSNIYTYCYCTKESDPIEKESYFFDKYDKVVEEINSLQESVDNYMTHEFVDIYRDKQIKYEDEEVS